MKNIYALMQNRQVVFIICLLQVVLYVCLKQETIQYYDSANYWASGTTMVQGWSIDLLRQDGFRGYTLTLFLGLFQRVTAFTHMPLFLYQLFQSAAITYIILFFLPKFYAAITGMEEVGPLRAFLLFEIFFISWNGYFLYSLSDIPAMFCFFGSIFFLIKPESFKNILFSGLLLGITVITRPAYQYTFVAFALYIFLFYNRKIYSVFFWSMAFGIVLLPQLYINYFMFHHVSPFVSSGGLMERQLSWGLKVQKYITFMGALAFNNPAHGEYIIYPLPEYFKLVFQHPISMTAAQLKKFFNGLDLDFSTPYPYGIDLVRGAILRNLNYIVLLLAFFNLSKLKFNKKITYILCLACLPVLMSSLGGIEIRFYIVLYMLLYMILCFGNQGVFPRLNVKHIALLIIAIGCCNYLSYSTYKNAQRPLVLNASGATIHEEKNSIELKGDKKFYLAPILLKPATIYKVTIKTPRLLQNRKFHINFFTPTFNASLQHYYFTSFPLYTEYVAYVFSDKLSGNCYFSLINQASGALPVEYLKIEEISEEEGKKKINYSQLYEISDEAELQ